MIVKMVGIAVLVAIVQSMIAISIAEYSIYETTVGDALDARTIVNKETGLLYSIYSAVHIVVLGCLLVQLSM